MAISTTNDQVPESSTQDLSVSLRKSSPQKWLYLELDLMEYPKARELQLHLVNARSVRIMDCDAVLFLEHAPVFTLGRRGRFNNQKVSKSFLESQGIPIIQVERGGDITYHGPGQLVVYPIVDLRASGWKVVQFVEALEEVMIRTLRDWGIRAERKPLNRGVWVGACKIGSIGIAVRRSISFHGLALNVNTDLKPFGWVHPCGLEGVQMTSMKETVGQEIPMDHVRRAAAAHMQDIFHIRLEPKTLDHFLKLHGAETSASVRGAI